MRKPAESAPDWQCPSCGVVYAKVLQAAAPKAPPAEGSFAQALTKHPALIVQQELELAELFGFETRNRYSVRTENGAHVAYAAEQQKGVFGLLMRQFFGHWRRFEIRILDAARRPVLTAVHPFWFFFQRLEVYDEVSTLLGAMQRRFALLTKRFDVEDARGRVLMQVASPVWKMWTFEFEFEGLEKARIEKKWSGLQTETFVDKDRFRLKYGFGVSSEERQLLLAAAIFVDLLFFEKKA